MFAVPLPVGVGQHVPVCPWHLARFVDAYEAAARSLRGRFALDRFTPETALVTLADAPAELDVRGTTWERAGLDQEGRAHYHGRLAGSQGDTGDSHKIGENRLEPYSVDYTEYYVTPMLTSYDRQFVGDQNECGNNIDDPANGDVIYLEHLWSNCFDDHMVG